MLVAFEGKGNAVVDPKRSEDAPTGEQSKLARTQKRFGRADDLIVVENAGMHLVSLLPGAGEAGLEDLFSVAQRGGGDGLAREHARQLLDALLFRQARDGGDG